MPSNALLAHGCLIAVETTTGVFVDIAELTNIDVAMEGAEIRTSIHNEPNAWDNYLLGPKNMQITIAYNYLPNNVTHNFVGSVGILYHFVQGTKKNMRFTFVGGSPVWGVRAFFRNVTLAAPTEGVLGGTSVIRVDGAPTLA